MTSRRDFIKTASWPALSALAFPVLPGLAQWDFKKSKALDIAVPPESDPEFWTKIRTLFPMPLGETFCNTGTLGAMPTAVLETMLDHMRKVATEIAHWDYKTDDWISGYQPYTDLRQRLGRLINAAAEEIALTENSTVGMNYVSNGLELPRGSEILSTDQEHSGGRSGWDVKARREHLTVRQVPLPRPLASPEEITDLFKKSVTPWTRVIAIPHMISGTGAILPVKEICAEARGRGIFTIIDGAQAIGHIPVDVKDIGCDAYFASLHKWFLAPAGTGFLFIRKDRIKDIWTTLASGQWDNHRDDGYRLTQKGTGNLSLLMGLSAAIDFHSRIGPERIQKRIKTLGDRLRDGLKSIKKVKILTPTHPAMCAGITSYQVEGFQGTALMDALWERKRIRIRGSRQSTHIYVQESDVDATLTVVRDLAK